MKYDIYKVGGVILKDKKLLVARSKGKDFFVAPGGKIEDEESSRQALVRELQEEVRITIQEEKLSLFGEFYANAAGEESLKIRMDVFLVDEWTGDIQPDNEIEEIMWIDSRNMNSVSIGSIFEHEVMPRLKSQGLIN